MSNQPQQPGYGQAGQQPGYGQAGQPTPGPARPFGASSGGAKPFGASGQAAAPRPKARPVQSEMTFAYEYTVLKVKATLDPMTLTVKQGLRTIRVNIQQLKYLYVRKMADGQMLMLLEELPNGKQKLKKVLADSYAPGFQQLVDTLAATRPSADIRSMPLKEALRTMGTSDKTWLVAVLTTLIIPALVAIPMLPNLIHGIDFGETNATVSSIEKGADTDSHNVVLTDARALFGDSIKVTTVHKRNGVVTSRSYNYLVPVVPRSVRSLKGHPVHVVLKTDKLSIREQAALERSTRFGGVKRDVLWEGLDSDDADYFRDKLKVTLADDVKLVELDANPQWDLMIFLLVVGATFGIMALVMGIVLYKQHVQSKVLTKGGWSR